AVARGDRDRLQAGPQPRLILDPEARAVGRDWNYTMVDDLDDLVAPEVEVDDHALDRAGIAVVCRVCTQERDAARDPSPLLARVAERPRRPGVDLHRVEV